MKNMPFTRDCGCTVQIQIVQALPSACGEDQLAYKERIVIEPCHDHADHEHGAFRGRE